MQRDDVAADVADTRRRLAQLAEPLLHLAHDAGGVVEALADGGLRALHELAALAEPLVQLRRQAADLLPEELRLPAEGLADLRAQRLELLLHEPEGSSSSGGDQDRHRDPEHQYREHDHEPGLRHHRPSSPLGAARVCLSECARVLLEFLELA